MKAARSMKVDMHIVLRLLEDVNRLRSLTDHEADILATIIERDHTTENCRTQWTPELDRKLLRAARGKPPLSRFAKKHQLSASAVHSRLKRLRAKGRREAQSTPPDRRFKKGAS